MIASLPFPKRMLGILLHGADGFRRLEQRTIDADIVLCHPCGGKALLEALPHLFLGRAQ